MRQRNVSALKQAIGIDVGASNTKIGLVNAAGEMLAHRVLPSDLQSHDPGHFLSATSAVVEELMAQGPIAGIGLSLCSIVNEAHTGVLLSVNAPALNGLNLRQFFAERFACPVQVLNDVAAYALAESRFGAGQGVRRLLCLALGTGLAIAAVLDGRMYETWGGISADAGRIILEPDSEFCCKGGVRGSAEALCSVAHIERLARSLYQRENVTAREVIVACRDRSDPRAGQVMAEIGGHAGHLLALLSPVYFPQRILITGGTAEAGEPLLQAARQRYARLIGDYMTTLSGLETGQPQAVEIQKAELGPEAAVIGAVLGLLC